jgi:hypothetical protein
MIDDIIIISVLAWIVVTFVIFIVYPTFRRFK